MRSSSGVLYGMSVTSFPRKIGRTRLDKINVRLGAPAATRTMGTLYIV